MKEKQEKQTGECEQAQEDKPTARERAEHDATHMPFRDWVHTLFDGQRSHTSPCVEEMERGRVEETDNRDGLLLSQARFHYVLARPISSEPLNRMNPRYQFGSVAGVRNHSAECFVERAEGVFTARSGG